MADGYDRFENDNARGGSFVMGLLTGTVLGAGLGMLFAPKAGSELRNQITGQAGTLANTAQEGYRRASESANEWAGKTRDASRDVYGRAREAVARGAEEAQRYVGEATNEIESAIAASPLPEAVRGAVTGDQTSSKATDRTASTTGTGNTSRRS